MGLYLLTGLAALSGVVWIYLVGWLRSTKPTPPAARAFPHFHPFLVLLVAAWVALQFTLAIYGEPILSENLPRIAFLSMAGTWAVIIALLWLTSEHGLRNFGLLPAERPGWIREGLVAFIAAVLPVSLLLLATLPFRSQETQHPFFHVLRQHPSAQTIAWIALAVIAAAPLLEELVFRVVLQGWLHTRYPPAWAVGISAAIFAAVHGWPDALPLIPLAIILGFLYWRRKSYPACVLAHALFNAMYLLLALLDNNQQPTATLLR